MGVIALDSSVLIALLDSDDANHEHAKSAIAWARASRSELVISASVAMEISIRPIRRNGDASAIDTFLEQFPIRVDPMTAGVARRAAALRAQFHALKTPDAIIVASAIDSNATCLVTTDRRLPQDLPLPIHLAHQIKRDP